MVCFEQCFPGYLTDRLCAVLVCPRVNSSLSSDELLLEDLETEGERQLKSLLHHQLDTTVSIEQYVLIGPLGVLPEGLGSRV